MRAFFEIHDSTLTEFDDTAGRLMLTIRAVRIEWPTETFDVDGDVFVQQIRLDFDGAVVSRDSPMNPEDLLDGSFHARKHDAAPGDELDGYVIPISLRNAEDVRLVLQGLTEDRNDYVTLEINAKSMRVTELEAPGYNHKIRARRQDNSFGQSQ